MLVVSLVKLTALLINFRTLFGYFYFIIHSLALYYKNMLHFIVFIRLKKESYLEKLIVYILFFSVLIFRAVVQYFTWGYVINVDITFIHIFIRIICFLLLFLINLISHNYKFINQEIKLLAQLIISQRVIFGSISHKAYL